MVQPDAGMSRWNTEADNAFKLRSRASVLTNGFLCGQEEVFMELELVLPNWQLMELEKAAAQRGLTAGQLLRHLIRTYSARSD
jgi:hypothetical protein